MVYQSTEPDEQRMATDVTCLAVASAFMTTLVQVIRFHYGATDACASTVFATTHWSDHTQHARQHAYDL